MFLPVSSPAYYDSQLLSRGHRIKYYNNVLFHNVQQNFIVQTGDPTGTGKGGSSIDG